MRRFRFEILDEIVTDATPTDLDVLARMLDRRGEIDHSANGADRQVRVELLANCIADATPADLDVLSKMVERKRRPVQVAVTA